MKKKCIIPYLLKLNIGSIWTAVRIPTAIGTIKNKRKEKNEWKKRTRISLNFTFFFFEFFDDDNDIRMAKRTDVRRQW